MSVHPIFEPIIDGIMTTQPSIPARASDGGPEAGSGFEAGGIDWQDMTEEAEAALRRARRDPDQGIRHLAEALDWCLMALDAARSDLEARRRGVIKGRV
jgi:hypothetical protein